MDFYSKITDISIIDNFIMDKNMIKKYLNSIFPSLINNKLLASFLGQKYLKKKKVFYNKKTYYFKKDIDLVLKKWLTPLIYKFNLQPIYENSLEHGINTHYKSKSHHYTNNTLDTLLLDAGIATKTLKDKMDI